MLYDVFICHASEDKDDFVRPLAESLKNSHLEVWYDEFSLMVGDSLRESIDRGLAKSRYGIVVLSKAFFQKKWPIRELNGLVAREMSGENTVILPIWHDISAKEIVEYSPPLADRKAINSNNGLSSVCSELLKKLRPNESPLMVARDELIYFGLNPPVVTDEWWLDVVEASNRIPCWGFVPPEGVDWGRWTFPLPNFQTKGLERGVRLAWTAMQMKWEKEAEREKISQITKPEVVLQFIDSLPGLKEVCHDYPSILAQYAPQITINGLSGDFKNDFDLILQESMSKQKKYIDDKSNFGAGLTTNVLPSVCSVEIALRHHTFGNYRSDCIACQFVQGELGGPHTRFYEVFDYIVWFLSSASYWFPEEIRFFLIDGLKRWSAWTTSQSETNSFLCYLWGAKSFKTFRLGKKTKKSLLDWIKQSLDILEINDEPEKIFEDFINHKFIEYFFSHRKKLN